MKRMMMLLTWACLITCNLAQADWTLPPVNISPSGVNSADPIVAVDPAGNAIAVWYEQTNFIVQAARLATGTNTWVQTADIAVINGSIGSLPQLALDSAGNAVVIWSEYDNENNYAIRGATLAAGSNTWKATLGVFNGKGVTNPILGVDSSGNAVAVWGYHNESNQSILQGATLDAGRSGWFLTSSVFQGPHQIGGLGMDASGNAIVVWFDSSEVVLRGAILADRSLTWTQTSILSNKRSYCSQIAMGASGNAVAVWVEVNGLDYTLKGATLASGTNTWESTTISDNVGVESEVALAADHAGNAIALWTQNLTDSSSGGLKGATLAWGSSEWVPTSELGESGAFNPKLCVDSAGHAIACWTQPWAQYKLQTSVLFFGNSVWNGVTDLTDGIELFSVAANGYGFVVAVWEKWDGSNYWIQGAVDTIVGHADPLKSTVTAHPNKVIADGQSTSTITVRVVDALGNPIPGKKVSLAANQGHSVISEASGPSDAEGNVIFTVTDNHVEKVKYTATVITDKVIIKETTTVSFIAKKPESPTRPKPPRDFRVIPGGTTDLLFWNSSVDPSVVSYQICNHAGKVVVETDFKGPYLKAVVNRDPTGPCKYTLVAIDARGRKSEPLTYPK